MHGPAAEGVAECCEAVAQCGVKRSTALDGAHDELNAAVTQV